MYGPLRSLRCVLRLLPFGLVGLALLLLWIWAIFDVIATDSALVRNLPKGLWVVLVIILPQVGSIAWLLLGRPQYASFAPGGSGPGRAPRQPGYKGTGPYGPDNASRYLADYDVTDRRSAELDAQLAEWEQRQVNDDDLRRRAAELDARQAELDARERKLQREQPEQPEQPEAPDPDR
jgi:Phospholipase_D-nuclease N-terminal